MGLPATSSKSVPAMKVSRKGSSGAGSSGTKSPFKTRVKLGKVNNNEIYWVNTAADIMMIIPKKANKNEGVYLRPTVLEYNALSDTEATATGIIAVVNRRGSDGKTDMPSGPGSEFGWTAFLAGMEEGDGESERKAAAQKAVDFLNQTLGDSPTSYRWKQKPLRLMADRTATPPVPVDQVLLTQDLLSLLDEANPSMSREEIANKADAELQLWFSDVAVGRTLILGGEE
jgi:hypothetical protein